MGKIELASQKSCTGCSACADVCPKSCIQMKPCRTLHLYPIIDESICIECGRCVRVCPDLNHQEKHCGSQHYYAAWTLVAEAREASTSGGVGSAITTWAINNGYVVYGAAFDDCWILRHTSAENMEEADRFRQSKYLQSSTVGIFKEIVERLNKQKKVLYIGTPCQVAGLLKVVPESKRKNLVTVDIICHGVNSPLVWKDYVAYLQEKFKSLLIRYNFRDKSHGWERKNGTPNLRVSMRFENGTVVNERAVYNQFHYWFGKHFILREACLNCIYRTKQRVSDISIGDFWGVQKIIHDIDVKKGVSAVITNTVVGENIVAACRLALQEVSEAQATSVLKGYIETRTQSARDKDIEAMHDFTTSYIRNPFTKQVENYRAPNQFDFLIMRIKSLLSIR